MIDLQLENIPKSPGIYKYYDNTDTIIYIGKSVNLFSRVHSYFNGKTKLNFAKKKMVEKIVKIETIIVENETESLILETNLIKRFKPKYNILMKDDKNYLYIKITSDTYPKILKTRLSPQSSSLLSGKKNGTYFGPYISTNHVNNILKIIKKYFGYGCYGEHFFKDGNGYNLDKYLFKNNIIQDNCNTTVEQKIDIYNNQINSIKDLLKGNYRNVIDKMTEKMHFYAKNMQFEEAQKVKEQIESLKSLDISQNIRDTVSGDYDFIHYIDKFDHIYIGATQLRGGKILGYQTVEVENNLEEKKEIILKDFLEKQFVQYFEEKETISFILPFQIEKIHSNVQIEYPQIGPKKELLQMTYKNLYEHAYKKHLASLSTKGFTKKNMSDLLDILGYTQYNKNLIFECNDISHFSGSHTVASRSIIENGKPNNAKYKKFNIKTLEEQKIDDFGSMKEVMNRRLLEIKKTQMIPDLIIIDGGKGQLGSVLQIIHTYKENITAQLNDSTLSDSERENNKLFLSNLNNLQLVSIAKKEEELFLPGTPTPVILSHESQELKLTQKLRDEAHRFAITFNRDKRIKSMKKNILESLPGFGPTTRKKILKHFGSVENISQENKLSLEKHLNKNQIQTLIDHGLISDD
ncbi:MAG: excinuclease ABC subunit C [Candidatus Gracilibacteria bacterium]|nr:excinuclease ABC subunit C [Candidatus Gracilibacteria bacterium]